MLPSAKFVDFIDQNLLFAPHDRVLLAVSGGRDSVLMAHLFKASGYSFAIAHVNFKLRAEESDGDEAFCRDLAASLDVPFFLNRFDTATYAKTNKISVQMAARNLRYHWLEELRAEQNFDYIALAHHQNDSIETILLNLTRGTGISGLHGILPKRGRLIRPLLFLTRAEIDQLVEHLQMSYRDDSSNESAKYARNKIRLEVIPKLKELNPALEETFELNRRRMADLEELLHLKVEELRKNLFQNTSSDTIEIDLAALQQLKPVNTLLFELFREYGFTEAVLSNLVESWHGQPGKVFESASHQLLLDRGRLLLSSLKKEQESCVKIDAETKQFKWNNRVFAMTILPLAEFKLDKHPGKAQLDADLLNYPLTLRSWNLGDAFQPFGMKGKKKLSDLFTEQKIPLSQKQYIGVLENANGDIVWVQDLRIDERYKISANTKKVVIFEEVHEHGI